MPPEAPNVTPQGSTTPLISRDGDEVDGSADDNDPKTGKRRFFGLGKKKEEKKSTTGSTLSTSGQQSPARSPSPGKTAAVPRIQPSQPQTVPSAIPRHPYPSSMAAVAASPSKMRSSSPRLHSPASSEIFERSVQEPVQISTLHSEHTDEHIPTHVITEDHIPPALEASAQAITSEDLNADDVEIVTSASHQPAGSILEGSTSHVDLTQLHSPMSSLHPTTSQDSEHASPMHQSGFLPTGGEEDGASNYGQLDPNDVRRLSFISFADVVQSEHHQPPGSALGEAGSRDSLHIASLPSSFKAEARAASPLRTPRSPVSMTRRNLSEGMTTPPPVSQGGEGGNAEFPSGRVTSSISPTGELTVETMRQAVRRTASGDLSGRSVGGMSPVSDEGVSGARSRAGS